MHRLLGHREYQPVGEALLEGGVGEHACDEVLEHAHTVARGRRRGAVATQELHLQGVTCSIEVLQVLGRADASQLALDHDAYPGAQGVGLLHGVCSQDRSSATLLIKSQKLIIEVSLRSRDDKILVSKLLVKLDFDASNMVPQLT